MQQNPILLNTEIGNIEIPVSKYALLLRRALGLTLSSDGDNRKVLAELFSNLSFSSMNDSVEKIKEDLSLVSDLLVLMSDSTDNNQYAMTSNSNDLSASFDAEGVFTATWEGSTYVINNGNYMINDLVVKYLPQVILECYNELKNQH